MKQYKTEGYRFLLVWVAALVMATCTESLQTLKYRQ